MGVSLPVPSPTGGNPDQNKGEEIFFILLFLCGFDLHVMFPLNYGWTFWLSKNYLGGLEFFHFKGEGVNMWGLAKIGREGGIQLQKTELYSQFSKIV